MKLKTKRVEANLLAETVDATGVVVQLARAWRTVGGEHRSVTVQVTPDIDQAQTALILRELAAELESEV